MHEVENFIQGRSGQGFSTARVFGGKAFDEIFSLEGIPLFWFYKRYLLKHVLPKPLNTYNELLERKKLTTMRNVGLLVSSLALRKYILFNELRKIKSARKKEEYTLARKALFLTYLGHLSNDKQLYRIQGIINKISNDAVLEPFPLFVTPLSVIWKSNQEVQKVCMIYQYCDQEIKVKVTLQAEQISKQWKQVDLSSLDQAMTLDGLHLWPYLRSAFSLFMSKEFLLVILLYYETCKKIIEKENVAITFISGQNGLFERCMAAASRTKRIPCILIPHGYTIGYLPPQDVLENMYLPVFNKKTAEFFFKAGVRETQLRVTGPAMYDNIVNYKKEKNASSKKNILLLTQPLVEDNLMSEKAYFTLVENVLKEMLTVSRAKVTIKLHPREKRMKKYQEIAQRLLDRGMVSIQQKDESNLLYHLLAQANVVVNFFATAGVLEASILDVPSITFPFDGKKNNKYGDFDPSVYVWEIESLKPTIEQLLNYPSLLREKRREMVQEFCSVIDGRASERVAQWAYELLS